MIGYIGDCQGEHKPCEGGEGWCNGFWLDVNSGRGGGRDRDSKHDNKAFIPEDASVSGNGNSKRRESQQEKMVLLEYFHQSSAAEIHGVKKRGKARSIFSYGNSQGKHPERFHGMMMLYEIWKATELDGLEKDMNRVNNYSHSWKPMVAEVINTEDAITSFSDLCPILEREVPAGFADEVIYSLFANQSEDLNLLHEDLEQIDDVDIEEIDINWQIEMIAIQMKKFYKKTGRRVRIDGNKPVGFDKKKLECFKCHNTGHFARECPSKGINDGKKRDSFYQDQGAGKKEQNQN
ncbi:ribonuclease H-like domain-containing protein [Tanacetum coccineum]